MPRAKTARNGSSESTTTAAAVQPAPIPEVKAAPAPAAKAAPAPEVKVSPAPAVKAAPAPEVKAAPAPKAPEIRVAEVKPAEIKPAEVKGEVKAEQSKRNGAPQDLEGEIRARAYELYEKRGRTPGHECDDWAIAEREVMARYSHPTA
jgi:hypothetical protein